MAHISVNIRSIRSPISVGPSTSLFCKSFTYLPTLIDFWYLSLACLIMFRQLARSPSCHCATHPTQRKRITLLSQLVLGLKSLTLDAWHFSGHQSSFLYDSCEISINMLNMVHRTHLDPLTKGDVRPKLWAHFGQSNERRTIGSYCRWNPFLTNINV